MNWKTTTAFIIAALLPIAAQPKTERMPPLAPSPGIPAEYKNLPWDDLVPKDWDPSKPFKNLNLGKLKDGDPRAQEVLDMMKSEWDSAPINPELDGKKIKIPGFVVPLEENQTAVSEFLLVPYFGACIHVPPPPANQIIHVITAKPVRNLHMMDTVWVAGELKTARFSTQVTMGIGASGYEIKDALTTPYKEDAIMTMMPAPPRRVPKRSNEAPTESGPDKVLP